MFFSPAVSTGFSPVFNPTFSRRNGHLPLAWSEPGFTSAWPVLGSDWQGHSAQFETTEQGYTISLDVPGLRKEHLSLEVEGRVLRVRSAEGAPRQVQAAYRFPQALDAEATVAKLEDGVLTVQLVKLAPVSNARSVNIQ